ncbi:DUF1272 domain-containing protein [Leisingera aquaemixtae]|uniref:DUF1272 domain-containing protein n=1 Tax=Leisingera TaxID=191028 RepID=UPI001C95174D|nr:MULTISPECIES: DUF1272 domain-containing protein [Leisingera]MBY6066773.1 DUF1272 domain-containing protein [Leisingera aquaemixtae]MCB4458364.1 DUF1272 domain-containing protein [Leisingera sp. McT4-56]
MLELRPNCELCDKDLPPDALDACICSYECTYCADCVETVLHNICPTCGGGFAPRPVRPRRSWREGLNLGLAYHPASQKRRYCQFTGGEIEAHVARIRHLKPEER